VSGTTAFEGRDLIGLPRDALRRVRGAGIGMGFQEPMTSLTPVLSVGRQLAEAIGAHRDVGACKARAQAIEMLEAVGIPTPAERLSQCPHEFSGGTHDLAVAQRIAVMRAGRLVELGPTDAIVEAPLHAYTRALLSAVPLPDPSPRGRKHLPVPAVDDLETGWTEAAPGHFVRAA